MGACASYCDPETWPTWEELEGLHPSVDVAMGWHPKKVVGRRACKAWLGQLEQLLRHPRVVALGEVGLDHSIGFDAWGDQNEALLGILRLARRDQVVIFHARGMVEDEGSEAVLHLLKCWAKVALQREQPMYLHCFTGGKQMVEKWLQDFPNCYFGFTKLAQTFDHFQREGLAQVPENRILIETDAPYFPWPGQRFSAPPQVVRVAEVVAQGRGMPVEEVVEITRRNALHLFHECRV